MKASQRLSLVTTVCTLVAGWSAIATARIIYVDADAPAPPTTPSSRGAPAAPSNPATGSSWASAYTDLRAALEAARIGDEIRIAQGIYRAPTSPKAIVTGMPLVLTGGLTLVGGYAGFGAPDPNARAVELYATILSGDVKGNDAPIDDPCDLLREPTRGDNCSVISSWSPPRNILDGLTIRGGHNAITVRNTSLVLRDCTFAGNLGRDGSTVIVNEGDVHLEHCRFIGNAAESLGGGLFLQRSGATLIDCEFIGNYANLGAGVAGTESLISLSRCTFRGNSAGTGGGVWHQMGSFQATDCRFENNVVLHGGGAIAGDLVVLHGCRFRANSAGSFGGALCEVTWPSEVSHCLFVGNDAPVGGALYSFYSGPLLRNCTLTGNRAQTGRAFAWADRPPVRGRPRSGQGTTVISAFQMAVINCVLWDGPGEMGSEEGRPAQIAVTYSDVFGGWPGEGNFDADPLFADSGRRDPKGTPNDPNDDLWVEGDYHLKSQSGRWDPANESWVADEVTSPCIDAGDPKSAVADEPPPNGGRINLGAYGGTPEASKSH